MPSLIYLNESLSHLVMKNTIIFTFIALLFFACKSEPKRTDYIINGSAEGVYNGVRTYLKLKEKNGIARVIDTAIVFDEKFTFTGKVLNPSLAVLSVNSVNGDLNFMLENSRIDIFVNKSNITQSKVEGSMSQNDFKNYEKEITALRNEAMELRMHLRNKNINQEPAKKDSITQLFKAAEKKQQEFPINFIKANANSPYSLVLIDEETNKRNANIEDYLEAYEHLDAELQTTPTGISVKIKLDNLFATYKKTAQLQIGKVAPNFEAPTPDGQIVSLNQLKGKVTIIDFWAAWCGPCRRENPNVVKIYNQYHNQGLEIIGVSLDGSRTQKDPKQTWLNAIEKDKLTWTQVSNLQYFQDPVAQLYNITAIPATYILDAEGKIVAKNLRGRALEEKVKELLQM